MCGIAGIYAYDRRAARVDERELLAIRDIMVARGPDGAGLWIHDDKLVGFGHRRLAIIDLSPAGAQPMVSANGRFVITYNGEIYNYRALRASLEQKGYVFRSESDTEVLLHLFDSEGPEMLNRLRGMYAIAIWDDRDKSLFLARDAFGIKPLYYAESGGTVRFASQVKALLSADGIEDTPDPAGHVGFFTLGYVPDPHTLFKSIRALPAGTWMQIDERGARQPVSFFSIRRTLSDAEQQHLTAPNSKMATIGQVQAAVRDVLADSVHHHLVADVPVGVFLSSGLDSATIVALAAEEKRSSLRTVTLGFSEYEGSSIDEVPLAEEIARQFQTSHTTESVSREHFLADREALLSEMDQPSIDGVNTYHVSRVVAKSGLKAALSGLGGDELFAGYGGFRQIPRLVRAVAPFRSLGWLGGVLRHFAAPVAGLLTSPKYAGVLEYGTTVSDAYLLRRALFMPWELTQILDPELAQAGWRDLNLRDRLAEDCSDLRSDRLKVSALELNWYMRGQLLRDSDWAGMAHSLEIRVPFVDVDVLGALAPMLASEMAPSKQDMVGALPRSLPEAVVQRPKTGFTIPVREWLTDRGQKTPASRTLSRGLRAWAIGIYAGTHRDFLHSRMAEGF